MSLQPGLLGLLRPVVLFCLVLLAGRGIRPEPWGRSLMEETVLDLLFGIVAVTVLFYAASMAGMPALLATVLFVVLAGLRGLLRYTIRPIDPWIVGIVVLGVGSRIIPVLGWNAPLFLDPAVEASLAARMLSVGQIPADWGALAPIAVNHQPGFAALMAVITGTARLLPRTVLLFSAFVQVCLPVAIYMVARALTGRRTAIAAGYLAVASVFPTYTVVAGMNSANLAFLMAVTVVAVLCRYEPGWPTLGLLLAGTALVHPLGALVVGLCMGVVRLADRDWRRMASDLMGAVVGALLVLPYYLGSIRSAGGAELVWHAQARLINPARSLPIAAVIEPLYTFFYNPAGIWYQYLAAFPVWKVVIGRPIGNLLVVVFGIAVVLLVRERRRDSLVAGGWLLVFWLLSWGQSAFQLRFPGWQFIYPTRMKFFMVLPLSLLLATAVRYRGFDLELRGRRIPVAVAIIMVVVPVSLVSMVQFHQTLDSEQVVADGDLEAMDWIRDNTARDAVILNELESREAGTFIGDAGQWIPVYTGRDVVYPALSITGNVSSLQTRTELYRAIRQRDTERFRMLVDRYGVDYVMLSRGIMVLYSRLDRITRQDMIETCACRPVFENERAVIFEVR